MKIIDILNWDFIFEFVIEKRIHSEKSVVIEYIYVGYLMSAKSCTIECDSLLADSYERNRTYIENVPEDILKSVQEYISNPFFEIDLARFKRQID
jgi:hypothetical protein